ncbi:MAG: LexA family protein [Armatimonadota bacterium]
MTAIGELLKREREKRGWTQRQLAIYAGVSNTAISDTESGKSPRPSADLLVKVSRGLGIDVAPLLVATGYLDSTAMPRERFVTVPIIGIIRAGPPLMAIQEEDGGEEVPEHTVKSEGYYFLRVRGDSMTGLGIMPGSLVLVRPTVEVPSGTVAVVIENRDDACVKVVKFDGDRVILRSANPDYPDRKLQCSEVQVIGEVVEVRTRLPLPLRRL